MHRELHDLYFDGDTVVVRLSLIGTHRGDLPVPIGTIPATGNAINVPSCDLFTIEGGKRCAGELGSLVEEIAAQPEERVVRSRVDYASQCCTM
jgi:hypothetical protein